MVAILLSIALLGNAVCFYLFEHDIKPELTWADSLWFSIVSISTMGYGDITPATTGARTTVSLSLLP